MMSGQIKHRKYPELVTAICAAGRIVTGQRRLTKYDGLLQIVVSRHSLAEPQRRLYHSE